MKAIEIKKKPISIEAIYEGIKNINDVGDFKTFYPHHAFITEEVKLQLIEDGYKVYKGDWDGIIKDALIIEW